jgi:hypothetical protein
MTKHIVLTGFSLLAYGFRTGRDVHWLVQRRLQRS